MGRLENFKRDFAVLQSALVAAARQAAEIPTGNPTAANLTVVNMEAVDQEAASATAAQSLAAAKSLSLEVYVGEVVHASDHAPGLAAAAWSLPRRCSRSSAGKRDNLSANARSPYKPASFALFKNR